MQAYNTSRGQFPSNMTAKMFGFKEYPFFQAPPDAKTVPKVTFTIALDEGGSLRAVIEPTHSAAWEASKKIVVTP